MANATEARPDLGEDLSDHINDELRQAFAPTGAQRLVKLSKRYDKYMVGEVVSFPAEDAATLVRRELGVYVESDAEEIAAQAEAAATAAEPLVGVKFHARWSIYMRGDVAGFSADVAEQILAATYKDEQKQTRPLAERVVLPDAAQASGLQAVPAHTGRQRGGKNAEIDADANG